MSAWVRPSDARDPLPRNRHRRPARAASSSLFAALQTGPGQRVLAGLIRGSPPGQAASASPGWTASFRPIFMSPHHRPRPRRSVADRRQCTASLVVHLVAERPGGDRDGQRRACCGPAGAAAGRRAKTRGRRPVGLPVGIDLRALEIDDLHLAAAVAHVDSHWKLSRQCGPAGRSRRGPADPRRRSHRWTARPPFRRHSLRHGATHGRRRVSLSEKRGGLVAALLERPDIDDLSMRLTARGDAKAGGAELVVAAGDAARAKGTANWEPRDGATSVTIQLDTAGPGLPQGRIADAVRQPIVLSAGRSSATIDTLTELRLTAGPLGVTHRPASTAPPTASRAPSLRADEPGTFGPFVDGVTWRGLHLETKIDLSGLATRPRGTIALKVAPKTSRSPPWTSAYRRWCRRAGGPWPWRRRQDHRPVARRRIVARVGERRGSYVWRRRSATPRSRYAAEPCAALGARGAALAGSSTSRPHGEHRS